MLGVAEALDAGAGSDYPRRIARRPTPHNERRALLRLHEEARDAQALHAKVRWWQRGSHRGHEGKGHQDRQFQGDVQHARVCLRPQREAHGPGLHHGSACPPLRRWSGGGKA